MLTPPAAELATLALLQASPSTALFFFIRSGITSAAGALAFLFAQTAGVRLATARRPPRDRIVNAESPLSKRPRTATAVSRYLAGNKQLSGSFTSTSRRLIKLQWLLHQPNVLQVLLVAKRGKSPQLPFCNSWWHGAFSLAIPENRPECSHDHLPGSCPFSQTRLLPEA